MLFKQWLEQFGDPLEFLQKFAPKHKGTNDIDVGAHGTYASYGYGMHQKITDPKIKNKFIESLPAGSKVVQVDSDGESLYRLVELPDGSYVAEKNVPGETIGWENIKSSNLNWFPKSWENAVKNEG